MAFKKRVHHSKPKMTKEQLSVQMKVFLAQCRDEALMRTNAQDLADRYKVSLHIAEQELIRAKGLRHAG